MRAATGFAVLLVMAMAPAVAPTVAVAASTPKVVVVPSQGKGGPNIKSQVSSLIEKGLKASATLIPFDKYSKAAKAAGVRSKSITGPEAVVPASRGVGATHVLIVESISDKVADGKKKKTVYLANVTLVDAVTGETLLSKRYPLDNKKLSSATASEIVGDVVPRFEPKTATPTPAAEPPPPPPPPAPAAPPPPSPPTAAPAQPPLAAPPPQQQVAQDDGGFGSEPSSAPPPPAEGAVGDQPPAEGQAPAVEGEQPPPPPEKRRESWRPGFRGYLGYLLFARNATLSDNNPDDHPPCYCERSGVADPWFSRGQVELEVYPFAFGGVGDWWEGFGVHGQASWGLVHTNLGGGKIASSNVGGANGGLTYRLVLWDSTSATDLQFRVGFSTFSFALYGAQFPATGEKSPYGGLLITQPITDFISVFGGANYLFRVIGFGGTRALGIQTSSGWGVHAELGVRATFLTFLDVRATGFFDQYTVPFADNVLAPSKLVGANPQFTGLTLKDSMYGVIISVGSSI